MTGGLRSALTFKLLKVRSAPWCKVHYTLTWNDAALQRKLVPEAIKESDGNRKASSFTNRDE